MNMRQTYGEKVLNKTLEDIADHITHDLNIYLIGGGAMMFYGLKPATKDIDIVFLSHEDLRRFVIAANKAGIKQTEESEPEYLKLGKSEIMIAESGIQLDLFNRVVCNALELKETVVSRASYYKDINKLHIYLMSREDIVLFKAITEREADLEDIKTLTEAGIDWSTVEIECLNQRESGIWADFVLKKLSELKEKYGITVFLNEVKTHADLYILRKSFKEFVGGEERSFKEIYQVVKEKTGYSETWTRNRLKELEEEGYIVSRKKGRKKVYRLRE
jgi:DNA-binding transcriptional ArsR family regulator